MTDEQIMAAFRLDTDSPRLNIRQVKEGQSEPETVKDKSRYNVDTDYDEDRGPKLRPRILS